MKECYIIRDQEKAHFITTTVADWIDAFTRKEYRDVVIDSIINDVLRASAFLQYLDNLIELSTSFLKVKRLCGEGGGGQQSA